jgi:hypothetical protein
MNCGFLLISSIILPGCLQMLRAADSQEFRLGGARDAKVHIEYADQRLRCDVSFLPIKAFGASKNRELNLTKARLYCLRALVIRSGAATDQNVEIDGLTIIGAGRMDGIRYSQIFELPSDNLKLTGGTVVKKADPQTELKPGADTRIRLKADRKSGLLSRAADHKEMIDQIAVELANMINDSPKPDLDIWVADNEDKIICLFQSCSREVSSDNLLLKIEKEKLLAHINEKRTALIRELGNAFERHSKKSP